MCRRIKVPRTKKQTHCICLITPSEEHLKSELGVWGFFWKPFFFVFPYMCLISLDCSVLLCFLSPLTSIFICLFAPLSSCHNVSVFIASFPVFIFAHMVSPLSSDLHPAPPPQPPYPPPSLSVIHPSPIPETLSNWWRCQTTVGPWGSTWCLSVAGTAGKNNQSRTAVLFRQARRK